VNPANFTVIKIVISSLLDVIASPQHDAALKNIYGGVAISQSGNEMMD
jgi:hypothetical protein